MQIHHQLDKYSPVLQIDLHSENSWEIKAIKRRRNGICKDELSYLGIFMSTAEDASQQTGRRNKSPSLPEHFLIFQYAKSCCMFPWQILIAASQFEFL